MINKETKIPLFDYYINASIFLQFSQINTAFHTDL